jgi:iron-sulfur cluster assembly accessory protein
MTLAPPSAEAPPVVVTDAAVTRIKFLQDREGKPGAALRLRIVAGGCSGMQYRIDLAEEARPTDRVVQKDGVRIAVDTKSVVYLTDSTLDWEEDFFGGEFKVKNPNAKTSCSCGISFTV